MPAPRLPAQSPPSRSCAPPRPLRPAACDHHDTQEPPQASGRHRRPHQDPTYAWRYPVVHGHHPPPPPPAQEQRVTVCAKHVGLHRVWTEHAGRHETSAIPGRRHPIHKIPLMGLPPSQPGLLLLGRYVIPIQMSKLHSLLAETHLGQFLGGHLVSATISLLGHLHLTRQGSARRRHWSQRLSPQQPRREPWPALTLRPPGRRPHAA